MRRSSRDTQGVSKLKAVIIKRKVWRAQKTDFSRKDIFASRLLTGFIVLGAFRV